LAQEWAARNRPVEDSFVSSESFSMSSTATIAHEESSHEVPTITTSTGIEDLALQWASRNKDTDSVYGALSSSTIQEASRPFNGETVPVQSERVTESFITFSGSSNEEKSLDGETVTSLDKELCFDDETGRFYETTRTPSYRKVDPFFQQISSLKRSAVSRGDFKALQKQIDERNTVVEGEGRYAVADGEVIKASTEVNKATKEAISTSDQLTDEEKKFLVAQIEKLTEPRPYPLFLAEKAVEFAENSVKGLCKPFKVTKKNLAMYSNDESDTGKKRIVVLGSGWGACAFLKDIDTDLFDVTIISPRNHFVFTPMLAGSAVGTVEYRSITQPIREINLQARFLEATATDVDVKTQMITCQSVVCDGNSCDICEFTVRYDRLVLTVGAQTNTFGIPGVREYCCFLKQVEDARRIRTAIVNCFERANLPNLTDEEREHDLTFVIIGAGPTGVEFAAELRDFVEQDGPKYYGNLVKYIRIKIIVSSNTVLAPFDKILQEQAIRQLNSAPRFEDPTVRSLLPPRFKLTELLFESRVKEVTEKTIVLQNGSEIPYGLAVWAAGNGPIPLTLQIIEALGEEQAKEQDVARGRIAVDPWMRAIGGEGKILAFGDCSCICQGGQQLPATAQVASQQGEYLASVMNRKFDLNPPTLLSAAGILPPPMIDPKKTVLSDRIAGMATKNIEYAKPFQFLNLGILAYTGGGSALAQVETAPELSPVLGWGAAGNFVWKGIYLSKQVSWRNRLLVMNDWTKQKLFGRDITRV
jgi:NADH dehydrogenase FAD-containing subunit